MLSVSGFQAKSISEIKDLAVAADLDVSVFSVCNTCVSKSYVKYVAEADIVCAGASKLLRKKVGSEALLQLGVTIPEYALTQKGKELVLAYLTEFDDKLVIFRTDRLPYLVKDNGPKLTEDEEKL